MTTSKKRRLAIVVVLTAAVLALVLVGARGARRQRRIDPAKAPHMPAPAGGAASSTEDDGDAGDAGTDLVEDGRRYTVRTWSFPLERFTLSIEDVGMTKAPLAALLTRTEAELAVNGGFFDPNGKALGLAISDGAQLSRASKTMSGGILTSDGQRAQLWEAETFALPEGTRFGVQCKPRLVVDGGLNIKRDDGHRSERTALCIRDGGHTIDVVIVRDESADMAGPSLFALGKNLVRRGCESALNLDGGPSTGVAWREDGQVKALEPRGPIRHAIVFKKR